MAGANILLSAGLDIDESLANLKKDIQTIQDRLNAAGIKITLPVDLDEKIVKSLKDIGNGKTTAESGKKIGDALATNLINQFNIKAKSAQRQIKDTCKQLYTVSVGELSSGQENPRFMQLFNELGEVVKSNANVLQSRMGIYDDFYNYFQNLSKIKIPSIVQTDLGKDWDSMRKVSAGKFVTDKAKSGTELDSIYQEMADKYKDIFSGTADPTEQFREIVNAVKAYRADIDRLEPVDPKKITGFEEDMWSDIITSIGQMREQIKAQMPQVTDEIEKNISNIKKSLMEVDASFDHTGIEQLTADVKQYFTALTGISDKDIKLQFFKDANEDVTSFNATLDRGQGILEKYSFTMNDLGQYVYTGGSLIDQSGKEFSEVSAKAAEYQKKLEALKSTYQSFLQGDSAANPFKALVDGIDFSNITDKGSLDQMIAKFNKATAQAKAFNAEISKKASFNAAEKLKQYLAELPAQIEYLETKFKGANFQIPDDVSKSFTSMRQCLQDINKTDGPEQKIKLYNQLTSELDKVTQKYKQLKLEQKNAAKDSALQSGKNLLGTNIDSWMNKNTAAAKVFADRLTDIKSKLSAADSADFNNLKREFNEIQAEAKQMGLTGAKAAQEMKSQFDSMLSSVISVTAAMQTFRKMVGTARELDTSLFNLQVATGSTREEAKALLETYNQMAKELGATTTDIADGADAWLRQGKSIEEANSLVKDSMILSKIGMIDAASATEDLTSVLNGFRLEAQSALEVVSKLSAVDLESASDAGGLAESMSRTATSANQAGVSIDELIGMIATLKDVTQASDQELGNAIKSIVSRYSQIKANKFIDYETGEDLSNVETVLGKIGIKIRDGLTDFRDLSDVLSELAAKYDKLNDVERNAVNTAMFGTYQQNKGAVLLSNWDKVEKLTKVSEDSTTEALDKFEAYTEGVEAHINSMTASYEHLASIIADSEFLKGATDAASGFLDVISQVVDKLGVLSTAAGAITIGSALKGNNIGIVDNNGTDLTILGKTADELERASAAGEKFGGIFNKSVKEPIVNAESIIGNYNELVRKQCVSQERINALTDDLDMRKYLSGLKGAEAGMTGYTAALNMGSAATLKLKIQTVALNVALNMGIVAAITAGITVLTKGIELGAEAIDNYVHRLEKAKEAAEDAKESYDETASKFESLNDEMKTTQSRMDELEAKDHLTFVEQEELDKLKATSAELKQQIELYQALKNMQGDTARDKAVDYFGTETNTKRYDGWDSNSSLADYSTSKENPLERTEKDIEQYSTLLSRQKELNDEIAKYKAEHVDDVFMSQDYNDKTSELSVIDKQLETLKTRLADSDTDFIKFKSSLNSVTDKDMIEKVDNLVNAINALFNGGSSDSTDQFDKLWNDSSFTSAKRELSKMASAGTLTPETLESNEKYKQLLDATGKTAQEVTDHIYALAEAEQQAGNTDVSAPFTKSEMIEKINGMSEGFEELDKIMASVVAKDKAFDFSLLDDKKFKDTFSGFTEEYNNFFDTISNNPKDIKACQSAFDDLVTVWVNSSGVLNGVSEDTAGLTAAMLSNMGVTNAEEIVMDALAKKHAEVAAEKYYNANATDDLKNATISECAQFVSEADVSEQCRKALARLVLEKISANNTKIDTSSDIDQIINLANAAGAGARRIAQLKTLADTVNEAKTTLQKSISNPMNLALFNGNKDLQKQFDEQGKKIGDTINKLQNGQFDFGFNDLDAADYKKATYGGGNDTANRLNSDAKSGKGKSEKDDKKFDWIKVKIDKVRESYEKLMDEVNDSDNAYSTQLNFLDAAIDRQKELIETEKLGIAGYQKEWEETSSKISNDIKNQIMNGDDVVSTYDGDKDEKLIKLIEAAQTAWNNLSDAQKQYTTDQKTLEDNEKSRYTKSIEWKQSEIDDLKEKADIEQTSYEKNIQLMDEAVKKSEELVATEKQHAEETKKAWEKVRDQLKPEDVAALMDGKADFEQYAESDPEYYEQYKEASRLYSEYETSAKKAREDELKLEETRKQAYEKGIEYIQKQRDAISGLNDKVQAEMDLVEQLGGITTEGMYRELIDNSKDMMELYESEVDKIKGRMEEVDPNSSEYYELLSNLQSCETSLIECQKNQAEWNEAIIRLPIERIQKYLNELANIKQDLNNFLSQKSSVGIATNKEQYQQLISIDQAQIDKYTEQQKKLQNLLKNYKYGSEKFNETSSEIQEIDNAISDLIVEMQDYNYQIARIPVDNLQKVVDTLDNAQTSIENLTAQQDARGIDTTIDQYQTMIDLASKRIEVLSTQRQMLVQLQSQFEKGSDRYTEIGSEIQDIDNTISGLIVNQYEWNKAMLQIPIDKLSNVNDELSAYSSILSDVLSEYDSALSGVTGTIDEQTKAIEDARSAAEDDYNDRIENIQKELDLLEKQNTARSKILAVEQAQYDLEKAKNQKTTQVVRNGSLVWENDPNTLQEKQQALEDALYEKKRYDLEQQVQNLEEERDALLENYDQQLEALDKVKSRWSEITDQIQLAADKAKAENLFGAGWEDKVLSGNDDDLYNMFKNLYTATSEQKDKVDEQISSNERIADMMQIYADRFQSGAMTYDQAMAGINSLATSMKDGYSALENLGDLMKADNIADLGSIASSATNKISESLTDLSSIMERVKNNYSTMDPATWEEVKHDVKEQAKASESLSASMNEFNQYLGTFKENTEAINKYTKTWDDMRDDLQSQLESLKKAAEALEKMSSSSSSGRKHSSSGGSSSSSKESSGTTDVYYHGHYAYSSDSKGNAYDKNGNSVNKSDAWNSAKDYVNEKKNYTKKHDGIASGLVGNNKTMSDNERESRFKKLGMRELDTNEIWVKALRDEVVLTKGQQETLLKNFDASMNVGIRTGAAIGMPTVQPSKQVMNDVVNVEIGDIHVHDVGDVNGFAKAVKTQIKPIMTQTFSRR
ncbi:MAG: phage tail tape measure protein [Clostridium sp.]|nr:phage tail tape measure protein [Clostridium sp.]